MFVIDLILAILNLGCVAWALANGHVTPIVYGNLFAGAVLSFLVGRDL